MITLSGDKKMRDKVSKIARIELDETKVEHPGVKLHSIFFESLPTQRVCCSDEELEVYRIEDTLLKMGYNAKILIKYRELIEEEVRKSMERETN